MNLAKNICYKVYVPVNHEKKDIGVSARITESMNREINKIAAEHDRPGSYVIRELLIRGLAAYQADGKLKASDAQTPLSREELIEVRDNVIAELSSPRTMQVPRLKQKAG